MSREKYKHPISFHTAILRHLYRVNDWQTMRDIREEFNASRERTYKTVLYLYSLNFLQQKKVPTQGLRGRKMVKAVRINPNILLKHKEKLIYWKVIDSNGKLIPLRKDV